MTKTEFKQLADLMVEVYGVDSYQDNLNDDPDDEINDELWFNCPFCGEPLLYEDWADSALLEARICPVCEERMEG